MRFLHHHVTPITAAVMTTIVAACSSFGSDPGSAPSADAGTEGGSSSGDATLDGDNDATVIARPTLRPVLAKRFGPVNANTSVTVNTAYLEPTGAVALGGVLNGDATFGGATFSSANDDGWVARFDAMGNHVGSRTWGDDKAQQVSAIVTAGKELFVGITFEGTFALNGGGPSVTNTGGSDSVVAHFDDATLQEHAIYGSQNTLGTVILRGMAPAAAQGVVVYGDWAYTIDAPKLGVVGNAVPNVFMGRTFPNTSSTTSTLCDYNSACRAGGVATNGKGDAVITGKVLVGAAAMGTITLASGNLTTQDAEGDAFIIKLDTTFKAKWGVLFGGANVQEGSVVAAVPGSDDFVAAVDFAGELKSPTGKTFTSKGKTDVYLARFGATGDVIWEIALGGADDERSTGIAVDATGNVFISGTFTSPTLDLGTGNVLTSADPGGGGKRDTFVLWLDPGGTQKYSARFGADADDVGRIVGVDAKGGVVLAGHFGKTLDFGSAGTLTAIGTSDAFFARLEPTTQ